MKTEGSFVGTLKLVLNWSEMEGRTAVASLLLLGLLVSAAHPAAARSTWQLFGSDTWQEAEADSKASTALVVVRPPQAIPWRRFLGSFAAVGPIPTGAQALSSALASMARAQIFKSFIALITRSGWRPIMQQYIRRVPVTMLAPTDTAMKALPAAYKKLLVQPKFATRFLQYHCLQQLWPYKALRYWSKTSPYPTAFGPFVWRMGSKTAAVFGVSKLTPVASRSTIIRPDVSGLKLRLIVVEGVNRALLHPSIFK